MRAYSLIRPQPWYRAEAFAAGLKAAGYEVIREAPTNGTPGDVLLTWNRYSWSHDLAVRFERGGGTVLVAENGYINADRSPPKFAVNTKIGPRPTDYYAIGRGYHNDAARVLMNGPERFRELGIELKPWRTDGRHVLIAANRAFGPPDRAMRADWADTTAARIQKLTTRSVVVRRHPGNDAPKRPLAADLEDAWCCVVWSSSAAVHALAAGVPTYIEAPHQIVKDASATGPIDDPQMPDRLPHFERMAGGQFRLEEIEKGLPFRGLFTGATK